jgi:hypothetical protein
MRKNLNRQVFGDGTGLIATLTSSPAAATTFTVDASQAPGRMEIDVLNISTGAAGAAGVTITASTAPRRRHGRHGGHGDHDHVRRLQGTARATRRWTGCATSPAPAGRCTASTRPRRQRVLERRPP